MALTHIWWAHCVCCHFSQSSLNGFTAQLRPIFVWPKLLLRLVPKKSKSQSKSLFLPFPFPFPLPSVSFSFFFLPSFLQMEMFSYWKQYVTFLTKNFFYPSPSFFITSFVPRRWQSELRINPPQHKSCLTKLIVWKWHHSLYNLMFSTRGCQDSHNIWMDFYSSLESCDPTAHLKP